MLITMPCDRDGSQQLDTRRVALFHFAPDLLISVWRCPGGCDRTVWHAWPQAVWPDLLRRVGSARIYRPAVLVDATVDAFREQLADIETVPPSWRDQA